MASVAQWMSTRCSVCRCGSLVFSASIRLADKITIGFGGSGGSVQTLGEKLKLQSKLSAIVAVLAGISAIAQGLTQLHADCRGVARGINRQGLNGVHGHYCFRNHRAARRHRNRRPAL